MKRVAKLILTDKDNRYLMLHRSNHPSFPHDPDLPGGTLEDDEDPLEALVREVFEETGVSLDAAAIEKVHESSKYDEGYTYYLYRLRYEGKPNITISWEHSHYEWLPLDEFISKTHGAIDKYMHMVHDYLSQNSSWPIG